MLMTVYSTGMRRTLPAVTVDIGVARADWDEAGHPDADVKNARQRQAAIVLPRLARRPGLLRFDTESAAETESEGPIPWAAHDPHEP